VIADSRVAELYGGGVVETLNSAQRSADLLVFPEGEANKNRESWGQLSDSLLRLGHGRDSAVLALGGGVTGDLAGFVAATFLRGVPLVQIPTTLLAMIDSSVGGKTGVDTPAGKNLIGSFHQPRVVIADTTTLKTLSGAELRSGIAEAIKHGAIADAEYFSATERQARALLALDMAALRDLIHRSVEIKAAVVGADEREGGLRKTLNFGHTIGHAVEALSRFELLHGEAIAIGMVVEAQLGESIGITRSGAAEDLRRVLSQCGLPIAVPEGFEAARILALTRLDKKARHGQVEYALLEKVGAVSPGTGSYGIPVPDQTVIDALDSCR
jgi:3-dehydroquinate synthase